MSKNWKRILLLVGVPLVLLIGMWVLMSNIQTQDETKYYQIVEYFHNDKIKEFELDFGSGTLRYKLREDDSKTLTYAAPSASILWEDIHDDVRKYSLDKTKDALTYDYKFSKASSWLADLWPMLVMFVLFIGVWIFMSRRMSRMMGDDRSFSFGKVKARKVAPDKRKTTFADVAGADEEKTELEEIVEFLRNPKKYNDMGARIPKGVLLVGPPGTGKTLLARAVAGEAGVPFFSISGSDFVEMFVGVGASRVRDLFEQAKSQAPAIVFIDEIDAVGRQRGAGLGGGHDEREQTLNQLLVEMDGFGANEGVIVIAATNRPDILDKALLRPGRFDRQITVNYPDVKGREAILRVHAKGKPLGPDVDLQTIARSTAGFTGADLENLLNEAALLATRQGRRAIVEEDIEEATIKVIAGTEKKSWVIKDKEKMNTAYHEAGHAVTAYYLPTQDAVHQITVIPRGRALGMTISLPSEDKFSRYENEMKEELVTLLGGRIAEQIIVGDVSTGASNDIERATAIARDMVVKYGMSKELGPILYGNPNDEVFLGRDYGHVSNCSNEVAAAIDREIHRLIDEAYKKGEEILTEHIDRLHAVAKYLFEHEKMDGATFTAVMEGRDPDASAPAEPEPVETTEPDNKEE